MRSKIKSIDLSIILVPLLIIVCICAGLVISPDGSDRVIGFLRNLFTNELGSYYIVVGFLFVVVSIWLAFSKYGDIKLGNLDKPKYSNFAWGSMIFTSTMAADILYYSLHEWVYYYQSSPMDLGQLSLAEQQKWASTYPLFHWGVTPWSFYILPAVAYAFMFFIRKNERQRLSEACRPVLGNKIDRVSGKVIDIVSVLGLLVATSTTFSLATPLLSGIISDIFNIPQSNNLTIGILLIIAVVYTIAVMIGIKGISNLAKICTILFSTLVVVVLFSGNTRYIIESGITGIGNLIQNFVGMSTWMDPARLSSGLEVSQVTSTTTGFPQDWTVFYWAYWIAWSVATPFFIATISEGRKIKNMILGGFSAGLLGTFTSFIVFGNMGLAQQVTGRLDVISKITNEGLSQSQVIIEILKGLPVPSFIVLGLVALTMIALYASTFDALIYVVSTYSYKRVLIREPGRFMKGYWALLMIMLPCALLFTEKTMQQLQSLSIIAAFPISILLIIIVIGFLKDINKYYKESRK